MFGFSTRMFNPDRGTGSVTGFTPNVKEDLADELRLSALFGGLSFGDLLGDVSPTD
jgi:hypothetical protein